MVLGREQMQLTAKRQKV